MITYPVVGKQFRMEGGIAYVSHISEKGNAVGYVCISGVWYGPVSWDEYGRSDLKKSFFNIQDGKFCAGNCLILEADKDVPSLAKPISEFLKKR